MWLKTNQNLIIISLISFYFASLFILFHIFTILSITFVYICLQENSFYI